MFPPPAPVAPAGCPNVFCHTGLPVLSLSTLTWLFSVAITNTPGVPSTNSGDAYTLPDTVPSNDVSRTIVAALALVSVGCTNTPSRLRLLLYRTTDGPVQ